MTLLELRKKYKISQNELAKLLNIPLRTYQRYENDNNYGDSLKRQIIIDSLNNIFEITEEHGILTINDIKEKVKLIFETYYKGDIDFCYLFGSYAKGLAKDDSDVDLYVSSTLTGFAFTGLIERLRQELHKKVDVIRPSELNNNVELTNEILKWGTKIYG